MPFSRYILSFVLTCVLAVSLALQVALPSAAQDVTTPDSAFARSARLDSLVHLGEITVTASRVDLQVAEAAQRITVLDSDDIEGSGARTLADLLAARSGLFIRRYGDGLATISLRGTSPSQALLLLDGMRLVDPQLGQLDLSIFPTYLLSTVEVVHGAGSALYGSDGIGGIINLRPHVATEDGMRLTSEIGAFGERRLGGGAAWTDGAAGVIAAAEYARAEGDFPYINGSLFPARKVRRSNADRESRSVYTSGVVESGRHRLKGGILYADATRGLPGPATIDPAGERQWDEHIRVWISDDVRMRPGRVSIRGFIHRTALRYVNPSVDVDDVGRTAMGYIEADMAMPVSRHWIADGGLAAGFAQARHPMLSTDAGEFHGSAFGELIGRIGRLSVLPAVRLDAFGGVVGGRQNGRRLAVSPRLGFNIQVSDRSPIHVKAALGRAFRNPTFNERYWQPGGNPDLEPERAWSYEAGLYASRGGVTFEATGFGARTKDQIVWTPERRVWAPENVSNTATTGIEASASAATGVGNSVLEGGATYVFTSSVDRSEPAAGTYGRQLRYVPRNQFKSFAGLTKGPLQLDVNARFTGRRYVTADESESLPSALAVDVQAGVRKAFGGLRISLFLFVENVVNTDYEIIQHYPMPPRHARVRLILETFEN